MEAAITAPGPALGRILGLDHVSLPVDDLDRAVRFYRDVLGADLIEVFDRAALRRLATFRFGRGPSLQLFVSAQRAQFGDDHPHWAFAIAPAEVPAFRQRLCDAGVAHVGPVRAGPLGQASIYLHDPAGNLIELTTTGYTGPLAG